MKQLAAIVAAVLATPLVIAVSFAVLSLWQLITLDNWSPGLAISGWILVSMVALPVVLIVVVAVAVPLIRRQQRRGEASLAAAVRLGVWLGVAPFLLFDGYVVLYELYSSPVEAPGRLISDLPVALKWATLAGLCGAGSAAAYWVAIRDR